MHHDVNLSDAAHSGKTAFIGTYIIVHVVTTCLVVFIFFRKFQCNILCF